jgi:peptidoglycan/xylan/chitin deacetylase (PgdA/CDA1 family)
MIKPLLHILVISSILLSPNSAAISVSKTQQIDRRISITVDDLPWAATNDGGWQDQNANDSRRIAKHHKLLIASMKKAKAPVVGFVNEGKLYANGTLQKTRVNMLNDWLKAGFELGNHTFGHVSLHDVGFSKYELDILKGEELLRPMLAEYRKKPQWFRHPYLRTGRTMEDKTALQNLLTKQGYRIAPVTVDNSDWIWALAYRKTLVNGADKETLARLRREYVPYMLAKIDFYERASIALLGYNLPQILLIHANELNAETYGSLTAAIRSRGYGFVSLEEAMQDKAYERADTFQGRFGPSWIHRWAIADKKPNAFYEGEPAAPQWVLDLAEVESE